MKALAWLLIAVSLVVAIVASVTAYSPRLALPEQHLVNLTLNTSAGRIPGTNDPLATAGTPLTPELIQQLRASGETRVRVKEFKLRNWNEWWLFALGAVGMLGGALLVRRETARQLAVVEADAGTGAGPDATLNTIRAEVGAVRRELPQAPDSEQRMAMIRNRIGRLIAEEIPSFVAARPTLVARLGLGGYAQLMDRFAAGERQLNRAWSAAADGIEEEAVDCLEQGAVLLEEAQRRMS